MPLDPVPSVDGSLAQLVSRAPARRPAAIAVAMGNPGPGRAAVLRASTVEAGQRCEGCDGSSTDCRARFGPCCPDCSCAPPPDPQPHRTCVNCDGGPWDDMPCPHCPCSACRQWSGRDEWSLADLAAWRAAIVETTYLCIAYGCGHRWLETTSPAYRHPDHCKVCGRRRQAISRGLGTIRCADAFVFDCDDGLGPMF